MGDCCNCSSEVSRDGSGQLGRYLKALDPSYALVDDRSIEELLVFTKRYANQVRFYDIPESVIPGDEDKTKISWREFFRRDIAVIAASISQTDIWQIKKDYEELRAKFDAHPTQSVFSDLFDPILGLVVKIDGWYTLAIPENPLYTDLQLAINSNLKSQVQKIVAYEEGFKYVDSKHPLNLDYSAVTNKDLWGLNDTINADISIYQGADNAEKILNAALYVDDIFNSFYGFLKQLITNSASYMQFALEQYPAHQPHMALFIAFLQLFRLAQDQANGITQRMLDFYYRDVLHLTAKPSIPDKAHIVFELAKDVAEYDVAPGTALKAGKDASGKDQIYITETDLVINQAKVKEIKNIFIQKQPVQITGADGKTLTEQLIQNIYARSVANSQDGLGEKFTDPNNTKWSTFGKGNAALNASTNICDQIALTDDADRKDQAQIGFAIASPQLVLQGGKRLIRIEILFQDSSEDSVKLLTKALNDLEIWLTGEKEWIKIYSTKDAAALNKQSTFLLSLKNNVGRFDDDKDLNSFYFIHADDQADPLFIDTKNQLVIYLPLAEQPVVAFNPKIHIGYNFKTDYPVMLIMNSPLTGLNTNEELYKQLNLSDLFVRTKVGSINTDNTTPNFDGLKKLVLQNKDGLIELNKPFNPFTAYPLPGRSFYIGSDEIFNKPFNTNPSNSENDALAVNIQRTMDNNSNVLKFLDFETYTVSVLKARNFIPLSSSHPDSSFSRNELTENIVGNTELDRQPINKIVALESDTDKGFIKLDFQENTYFVQFQGEFDNGNVSEINFLQTGQSIAPYLEINEVSISYDSTLELKMGIDQFFHIYPFGIVETYLTPVVSKDATGINGNTNLTSATDFSTLDKTKGYLLVDAQNALLPQFNYQSPYAKYYPDETNATTATSSTALKNLSGAKSFSTIENRTGNSRSINAVRLLTDAKDSITNNTNQYIGDIQEGTLYLGLEKLQPLQSISMLFQFAEGSAEDEDDDPPTINWSYLSYNEWKPMRAENIVSDSTYGFQTTGIIKIDIPGDASTNNTIVTDGLLWLSASVTDNANRIPQLIDIVTQAAEAVFQDQNNDQSHFNVALPAGSISKLSVPVAQVSKVQQPFASFDGKHQEVGKEFYTRVSERLRHKQRAITAWDYEHLVLDRFPSIYKVKCITHTDPNCLCRTKLTSNEKHFHLSYNSDFNFDEASQTNIGAIITDLKTITQLTANITAFDLTNDPSEVNLAIQKLRGLITEDGTINTNRITDVIVPNGELRVMDVKLSGYPVVTTTDCCGPQIAPGHVLLIPIANLKNRNAANPLQPKTSRRTLIAIQEYLKTLTSPFVHVYAKNPVYEQIIVSFKVQFYSGTDKGYYMKKLNKEIVRYLTPWAFDENAEVSFNQKIYASSIINFIEKRTYVDFITDFTMGVCCNDCCPPANTIAITKITVNVYDNDKDDVKKLIGDVVIKIKELNIAATTAEGAPTEITEIPAGTFTMLVYFSLFDIVTQKFTVHDDKTVTYDMRDANTPGSFDFYRSAGNEQTDVTNFFSHVCGCTEIEWFLKGDPGFVGDIVAEPCTPRSILVSVPQHIIVPYIPPGETTNCDKISTSVTNTFGLRTDILPVRIKAAVPLKSLPGKIATKKAADKSIVKTKAIETGPAKPKASGDVKKIKAAPKPSAKTKKSK